MLKLRDYQTEAVEALWARVFHSRSALCSAATGGGKTEIMLAFIKKCLEKKPDLKVVVVVQKINLLEQTIERFKKVFDCVSVYSGSIDKDLSGKIVIATIQSIFKMKIDGINLIVIDEVHSMDHDGGRYIDFIEKNDHEKLKIIGFTATPFRADGAIYGHDKIFEKVDYHKGIEELIEEGYLVRPTMKKPDHQIDVSSLRVRAGEYMAEDVERVSVNQELVNLQVYDALPRIKDRKKSVWACSSINHCEMVLNTLKAFGENAVMIHSKMTKFERNLSIDDFEMGTARHLVFVTIVSEGYDYPPIDCVVLMRATRSPVLYIQTVGRGLRLSEGKTNALVLDYGRVVETLGPLNDPSIFGSKKGNKKDEVTTKVCPECLEYVLKSVSNCPVCHYTFTMPKEARLLAEAVGGNILGKAQAVEVEIKDVCLSFHHSKSGNDCLKITYFPKNLFFSPINEFFVWNKEFAYKKILIRSKQLDFEMGENLEITAEKEPKVIPSSILVVTKNGYQTVDKLLFKNNVDNLQASC